MLAAAVIAALGAGRAAAEPPAELMRAYQEGIDAYRLGKHDEARAALERARAMDPSLPGPYRWLAAVDQAEQRWGDCVAHAREAIRINPKSQEAEATRKLHDDCRAALGRTPVEDLGGSGALAVIANVDGATVDVNGLRYGVTPLPPRLITPGRIVVRVSKPGWLAKTVEADIVADLVTDVEVTLDKNPAAAAPVEPPLEPDAITIGWVELDARGARPELALSVTAGGTALVAGARGRYELPPGIHELTVTAPGHEPWRRRVRVARGQRTRVMVDLRSSAARQSALRKGLLFVGSAAALAAVGATAAVRSNGAAENARDWWSLEVSRPIQVPLEESAQLSPVHTRQDIDDEIARSRRWALVSNVSYGVAAVSLGVGIYFLVKERPAERPGAPAPFAITPVLGRGEIGVTMSKELRW